ncbi:MAG: DUF2080 family transposase-associated protein [Candidatus Aenigmarchaeota archaeon]|nr:DUF2080 family transposase-associated protein [Candidatus Aenigmarchaeota archaeon]
MREIKGVVGGRLVLKDGEIALIYEKKITPYGNGAKVDAPKKHIGKRAYVVIMQG